MLAALRAVRLGTVYGARPGGRPPGTPAAHLLSRGLRSASPAPLRPALAGNPCARSAHPRNPRRAPAQSPAKVSVAGAAAPGPGWQPLRPVGTPPGTPGAHPLSHRLRSASPAPLRPALVGNPLRPVGTPPGTPGAHPLWL